MSNPGERQRPLSVQIEPPTAPLPPCVWKKGGGERNWRPDLHLSLSLSPRDPATWSNDEVIRWLKDNGLKDFKDIMYSNGFEGRQVLTLKPQQFKVGEKGCKASVPTKAVTPILLLLVQDAFAPDRCEAFGAAVQQLRHMSQQAKRNPAPAMLEAPASPSKTQAPAIPSVATTPPSKIPPPVGPKPSSASSASVSPPSTPQTPVAVRPGPWSRN
jgi:hypothetical protein